MLSGGAVELMVSVNAFDALPEALSVTWAVKLDVPAVVGVPLIAPEVVFQCQACRQAAGENRPGVGRGASRRRECLRIHIAH